MWAVTNFGKIIKYKKNKIRTQNDHDQLEKWAETDKSKFNIKVGEILH